MTMKHLLDSELAFVQSRDDLSQYHELAGDIRTTINRDYGVKPNYDGIAQMAAEADETLGVFENYYEGISETILRDYDTFLDGMKSYSLISDQEDRVEFGTNLWEADQGLVDLLESQDPPMQTWVDYQVPMVE